MLCASVVLLHAFAHFCALRFHAKSGDEDLRRVKSASTWSIAALRGLSNIGARGVRGFVAACGAGLSGAMLLPDHIGR